MVRVINFEAVILDMPNFRKIIDDRRFIFEYLVDKNKNLIAYLVTTMHNGKPITFEMETDLNGNWKFVTIVPREILEYESALSKAIDDHND
jgi:hypothetical protein